MSIKNERLLIRATKLLKKGKVSEAQEIYLMILKSSPNNSSAKKGLSLIDNKTELSPTKHQLDEIMQFYSLGQINNAKISVQKLIDDFPNESLLYNILGACYSSAGPLDLAILNFKKALSIKPDYSEAYYNLGVAYQKANKPDKAINSYERAISLKHSYPTAHNNLGLIFLEKGKVNLALKNFEWAVAYSPEYAEAHNSLGAALQELNFFKEAMEEFTKAIALNPEYSQAFHNLGILSEMMNMSDKAIKSYENALSITPEFAEAHRNLSKLKKFNKNDPQITIIEELYSRANQSLSNKVKLSFTLAKVHEDIGNDEMFLKYLDEGNKLRKQELNYSINESKNFHNSIVSLFNSKKISIKQVSNYSSDIRPIFIVGMPRSGTSLVEQIISSHNSVHGAGELTYFKEAVTPSLEEFINKKTKTISKKNLLSIREDYLNSLNNLNVPENIITDKMPLNFRLIGLILSAIPEAKIIHLQRDPIATCWSNYRHYFTNGNGFTFNQADLAKFYNLYNELMIFWHKLFPTKIYDLNYEKLTTNQEKETKKLLKFCDLDWDENCIHFHKNKRAVQTASASQVRKKMYQGSSVAWKKYQSHLQPLISKLNK